MKNLNRPLVSVFLLCLAVRGAYLLTLEHYPPRYPTDGYVEIAENILAGRGFSPTPLRHFYLRTPGYPLSIAALWSVVPASARFVALALAQVGLSAATCLVIYAVAASAFGARAALAAATLFALSPSYTLYCPLVFPETLFVFLMALAAAAAMALYRSPGPRAAVALGTIWGFAGLTRGEATFFVPLLVAPLVLSRSVGPGRKAKVLAALAGTKAAVMLPWVLRNLAVYGAFVMHVPVTGTGLFSGTYPHPPIYGRHWSGSAALTETPEYREVVGPFWDREALEHPPGGRVEEVVVRRERDFVEVDKRLAKAAVANIYRYKKIQVRNVLYHLRGLWARPAGWGLDDPGRLAGSAWYALYLGFLGSAVVGVVAAARAGKLGGPVAGWLLFLACHTALLLPYHTESRYQAAGAVFVFLFSGVGVVAMGGSAARLLGRATRPAGAAVASGPVSGAEV
jgi:4-amino-4-deoxy-L-arabinose transferase-like glycosyltransferase